MFLGYTSGLNLAADLGPVGLVKKNLECCIEIPKKLIYFFATKHILLYYSILYSIIL